MTDLLFTQISKYEKLTARDKMLIRNNCKVQNFQQGEFFQEIGKVANKVGFIASGIFRSYYVNDSSQQITTNFYQKNDFLINFSSFFNLTASTEAYQAETNSQLIVFERDQWNLFCESVPSWQQSFNLIANKFLVKKSKIQRDIISQDTKTVYLKFRENYPELNKIVPLGHIATYLGMTQSTLSRVRKKIVS